MSSYECQEPGCTYNTYAVGPLETEDDWDTQDNFERDIEDHEQRHREETKIKNAKVQEVTWKKTPRPARALAEQVKARDDNKCRLCGRPVDWVQRKGNNAGRLIHIDQAMPGIEKFIVGCRACAYSEISQEVVGRILAENQDERLAKKKDRGWLKVNGKSFEPAPESDLARLDRQIVLVQLDASVSVQVPLESIHGGLELTVTQVGVAEGHVGLRGQDDRGPLTTTIRVSRGGEEHSFPVAQPFADDLLKRSDYEIVGPKEAFASEIPDEHASSHDSSPSVGAPSGAGVGTSDPTDGDEEGVPGHAPGTPGIDLIKK